MNRHAFTIQVQAWSMLPPGLVAEAIARVVEEMFKNLEVPNPQIDICEHGELGSEN